MIRKRAFFKCLSIVGAIALGAPAARCQDGAGGQQFVRGDPDGDGVQSITDAIVLLGCLFLGTVCPTCADAADVNDDGLNDITDAVYLLSFIFGGGPESPAPIGDCGPDPTADDLGCASFPRCALIDPDAVPTAKGDLMVTPIEHASLVLRWDGKTIYVDPVGGAALYAGLPAPDLILVTHTHGDHADAPTIRGVAGSGTQLAAPAAVSQAFTAAGGVGSVEVKVLANGEKATVAGIEVEAMPMYNLTSDRLRYHAKGQGITSSTLRSSIASRRG